ncbi:MAG: hypothetical protein SOI24_08235 [Coriobacteriales bacterium]|jgi:hypothetical protein
MNKKNGAKDVAASQAPVNQDAIAQESGSIITPSTVESKSKYSAKQLEHAHRTVNRAQLWKDENPSAWQAMNELALKDARSGKRVSGSGLVEYTRKKEFTDIYGKPTVCNNDLAPVLARLIAKEHPVVARHLETRTGIYEEVGY